jgi:hypothetical protein
MGVRPDEYGVPDACGVAGSAADQRVLHDDDVAAEPNIAVLGGEDGSVEDDRSAQRRRGRDVGGGGDDRTLATVFENHADTA